MFWINCKCLLESLLEFVSSILGVICCTFGEDTVFLWEYGLVLIVGLFLDTFWFIFAFDLTVSILFILIYRIITCEFQLTFWIYLKTIVQGNFLTLTHFVLCTWKWCKICILRFFLSIIRHSLVIWGNSSKISDVLILQKRAVRVMSKAGPLDHCKPLFIPTNFYKFIYFCFNSLYTQKFWIWF